MITKEIGQCKNCKYFKEDFEYTGMGSCNNMTVYSNMLIMNHCDMFLISNEFGCLYWQEN